MFYHKKDISNVTIVKTSYFYFQVYCMHKLWPITSFLYVENTKYINKGKISTCKTYHFLLRCKQINNRNILQLLDHGVHLNYFHGIDVFLKGVIPSQKEYINHINHVFFISNTHCLLIPDTYTMVYLIWFRWNLVGWLLALHLQMYLECTCTWNGHFKFESSDK